MCPPQKLDLCAIVIVSTHGQCTGSNANESSENKYLVRVSKTRLTTNDLVASQFLCAFASGQIVALALGDIVYGEIVAS